MIDKYNKHKFTLKSASIKFLFCCDLVCINLTWPMALVIQQRNDIGFRITVLHLFCKSKTKHLKKFNKFFVTLLSNSSNPN